MHVYGFFNWKDKGKIMLKLNSWCPTVEDNVLQQIENACNHPALKCYVALMPDANFGYGIPIGSVIAAKNAVIPNCVGVDIGCGMQVVRLTMTKDQLTTERLKKILQVIRETVPVGMKHNDIPASDDWMPTSDIDLPIVDSQYQKALFQLGTLGGGNHFIEIQYDEEDNVWIMVHSGSRNLGYTVAKYYNDKAKELNNRWLYGDLASQDLAFLPMGQPEYNEYICEMEYCKNFAENNRTMIINKCLYAFHAVFEGKYATGQIVDNQVKVIEKLDVPHNYCSIENHHGHCLMIHRKGAILARKGILGIIPGSQGTNSYITMGLGNRESFCSSSHGSGRRMGRKQARKELDIEAEKRKMDSKGILHAIRHKDDLDEAPGAYKDIEEVMENQRDLTEIVHKLTPMAVVKG